MRVFEISSDNNLFDITVEIDETNQNLIDAIESSIEYWEDIEEGDAKNVRSWVHYLADQLIEAMVLDYHETSSEDIVNQALTHEAMLGIKKFYDDGLIIIDVQSSMEEEIFSSTIAEW